LAEKRLLMAHSLTYFGQFLCPNFLSHLTYIFLDCITM
jgi:hypothetical protein